MEEGDVKKKGGNQSRANCGGDPVGVQGRKRGNRRNTAITSSSQAHRRNKRDGSRGQRGVYFLCEEYLLKTRV